MRREERLEAERIRREEREKIRREERREDKEEMRQFLLTAVQMFKTPSAPLLDPAPLAPLCHQHVGEEEEDVEEEEDKPP